MIEDVVEVARRLAAGSPGARLDPPLGLILDEAANYPLPSLGALMSEGGGTGITTLAVLQSLAQARHRWGREQAQGMWDSAIVKIVLGGGSNADDLADIARLVGERTEREYSETSQPGWQVGLGLQPGAGRFSTRRPSARSPPATACCCLRSARPIMLTLRPWTDRSDSPEVQHQRAVLEDEIRTVALQDWLRGGHPSPCPVCTSPVRATELPVAAVWACPRSWVIQAPHHWARSSDLSDICLGVGRGACDHG